MPRGLALRLSRSRRGLWRRQHTVFFSYADSCSLCEHGCVEPFTQLAARSLWTAFKRWKRRWSGSEHGWRVEIEHRWQPIGSSRDVLHELVRRMVLLFADPAGSRINTRGLAVGTGTSEPFSEGKIENGRRFWGLWSTFQRKLALLGRRRKVSAKPRISSTHLKKRTRARAGANKESAR